MKLCGGCRVGRPEDSVPEKPLISILTVVFNGAPAVEDTIQSAIQHRGARVEYIVVDGGSTDETLTLLRCHESAIDFWVSEPDTGIYDAMNKGISLARGEFVYHLNVGDRLLRLPPAFECDIDNETLCIASAVQTSGGRVHLPSSGLPLRFHNTLHHQGCFYRKTSALKYDLRFKVFSDFDLNQRLLLSGGRILLTNDLVALHDEGGVSHNTDRFFEVYQIVRKNFGIFWVCVCFFYFKYRGLRRRLGLL